MRRPAKAVSAESSKGASCSRFGIISVCLLGLLAVAGGGAPSALAADCPNEAIREQQGTTGLPACMALEMVSPPKKYGQLAERPTFSPDGNRVLFSSRAALAETPGLQSVNGDRYVATRTSSGWAVAPTSPPAAMRIATGGSTSGVPYAFAPDFGRWLLIGATQPQEAVGSGRVFAGGLDGSLTPLSPLLVPVDDSGAPFVAETIKISVSDGTSADLSTTIFRPPLTTTSYLENDPTPGTSSQNPLGTPNRYLVSLDELGQPSLQLLARDRTGTVFGGRCGAVIASTEQGAISTDGSRIYFTTRPAQLFDPDTGQGPPCDAANPLRILVRTRTPAGPEISELIPGGPAAGNDTLQGASRDGSKVYFTTPRALAASDLDTSSDLYLYDWDRPADQRLIQVSAGGAGDATPGAGANVADAVAISADGSRVYFVSADVLTTDAGPNGKVAQPGQGNLYVYQRDEGHPAGRLAFVGTGASDSVSDAYAVPRLGIGGGDGHVLVFVSKSQMTDDDTDGSFGDVFRYDDAAITLVRISEAAEGGSEHPAAGVRVASARQPSTINEEIGRWVAEDGRAIAFSTSAPLTPDAESGESNAFLWNAGELMRVPDAREPAVIAADGEAAAFESSTPLLPQDGDTVPDVYVLRSRGGYPLTTETTCLPDAAGGCQGGAGAPDPIRVARVGGGNVPRDCAVIAKRVGKLERSARQLRQRAARATGPKQARRLRGKVRRLTRQAAAAKRNANRCRQENRRAGK